jgi:diguanylate cyclase (GGDEF)-like protein/PAS domain S-box-containing protein
MMRAHANDRRRAALEAGLMAVLCMAAVGAGITGVWMSADNSIRANYRQYLTALATAAAQHVDPVAHGRIREPSQMDGPEYTAAVEPLRRFRDSFPDIAYVYTFVRDEEGDLRFVLDAAMPGDHDGDGIEDRSAVWELYESSGEAMHAAAGDGDTPGVPVSTEEPFGDRWGVFMTAATPIADGAGRPAGIGVDVDARLYVQRLDHARTEALLGVIPALGLIGAFSVVFYRMRVRGLVANRESASAGIAARNAAAVLARQQRRLRNVIEGTGAGTWEWDVEAGVLTVSEQAAAMLGLTPADLEPNVKDAWMALMHPDDVDPVLAHYEDILSKRGAFEFDYRMRHRDGHWVWLSSRGTLIESAPDGKPQRMAGTYQDVTARKTMEHELKAAARHDKLTGLANRALFTERLERAIARVHARPDEHFAVLFLDFDHFKRLNDTLGHAAGDDLLTQIAGRLRAALRGADAFGEDPDSNLIARFGGDEFVVLLNDIKCAGDADRIARRLLGSLAPSFQIGGREVHSSASIGVVTSEQCMESAEAIIRNADVAMYEAKRRGRACSVVFDAGMHTRLTRQVAIENGLRKAIENGELYLVYQPIVDLRTGRIVSAEALVRWEHPQLGNVTPNEFIPIAEESGLIVRIGAWVLRESCRQLVEWQRRAPDDAPLTVSVNVSRVELALGERLFARIRTVLAETGLAPQCLQLEVTEREVMRDPSASRGLIRSLRATGVRLAMDDFGTGTSSLACLREYPFDAIKVDRAFVGDLAGSRDVLAVIHATITLVENLGMACVAEGVEEAAQAAILESLGCQYAQGYFFSRPVAPDVLIGACLAGNTRVAAG